LDGQAITRTERIQADQQFPRIFGDFQAKFPPIESAPVASTALQEGLFTETANDDGKNFNEQITKHTPEDRLRTARELAERRGNGQSMDHLKPKQAPPVPEPTFHPETGKIMQRNDGKYPFRFHHYADQMVLEVDLPKYANQLHYLSIISLN
jgi:protein TilB